MTTSGLATSDALDQRLDALDRALMGLVPRSERMELTTGIERRLREKLVVDPEFIGVLSSAADEGAASVIGPAGGSISLPRKRSRLALSAGVLGIIAVGLMLMLPVTYVVIVSVAESIGEVPAITLLVINILAVSGAGALAGILSLAAMVGLSRAKGKKRGLGWAITGLCTSPLPALVGLAAIVFFVLPISVEYVTQSNPSAEMYPQAMPVSQPASFADCSNGYCVPPPLPAANGYASPAVSYPPQPFPPQSIPPAPYNAESIPVRPVSTIEGVVPAPPALEPKVEPMKSDVPVLDAKPAAAALAP